MKLLIWGVTGFLMLLWTGAAAMLVAAVNWLAALSADPARQDIQSMDQWPVPEWLSVWMPPGVMELLKANVSGMLESVIAATNWIIPMLGWLSPVIWVVWGLVVALMLALAGGVHVLTGRNKTAAA
ncbi:MAG: hypothetical protein JWR74_2972 [Polaromonas sp.]|jgi:hypothetical protein|nr:hypothetical protein [Polaromonas sp.]